MTDKELQLKLREIEKGDSAAFEDVYRDMKTPLMTVIMRTLRNREAAEDILQEVFIKLYYSPPANVSKPRAYIFKTAANMAVDHLRKNRRTVSLEDCGETLFAVESDQGERLDIERAMGSLEDRERQIVTLHINGGFKFREIAEMLEMPLGTALWRYQRAIKQLRETLGAV
ncbi:MAG: RNA polymerase sigma factor [Bacteroides sp.]|nr:RNA polymerase sigma factor [Bacteroides sp.]